MGALGPCGSTGAGLLMYSTFGGCQCLGGGGRMGDGAPGGGLYAGPIVFNFVRVLLREF